MKYKKHFFLRVVSVFLIAALIHVDMVWALSPRLKLQQDLLKFKEMEEDRPVKSGTSTQFEQLANDTVQHQEELLALQVSQEQEVAPGDVDGTSGATEEIASDLDADLSYSLNSNNDLLIDYVNQSLASDTSTKASKPAGKGASGPALIILSQIPPLTNTKTLRVDYTVDGSAKYRIFDLIEGVNALLISEANKRGRVTSYEFSVTLDTAAPLMTFVTMPPPITNRTELNVRYLVDGAERSRNFILTEGMNQIEITETDAAGNAATLVREVTLDTVPPAIVLTGEVEVLTHQSDITLTYTVDGLAAEETFALNEGVNELVIVRSDVAGNRAELKLTVVRDTVAPEITLAAAIPALTNQSVLTAVYTVDGVLKETTFNLTEGANTISFREADAAGNLAVITREVTLDTVPPRVILAEPLPAMLKDASYTIHYTSDGVEKTRTFDLVPGDNALTVTESDAAGNIGVYQYSIVYKLPPVLALAAAVPQTVDSNTITVDYLVDGAPMAKTFVLKAGENIIELSTADELGQTTTRSFWVTSTAGSASAADASGNIGSSNPGAYAPVTVTTASGDKVQYVDGGIGNIRTAQGDVLNNIGLDASGAIRDAQIRLADGSVQLYENGSVIGYQRPDKTRIFYRDGRIDKIQAADGAETIFTYTETAITAESDSSRVTYETDGSLRSIFSKVTGTESRFDHGVLLSLTFADGTTVPYERSLDGDGSILVRAAAVGAHAADLPFLEARIDPATGRYARVVMPDGRTIDFDAVGNPAFAVDADGNGAAIDLTTSALGNLLSARLTQGGVSSAYDASGRLSAVTVDGLTVHYRSGSAEIDWIYQADGTVIRDLTLGADGAVLGAVITTADGDERTYVDGHLERIVRADETEFGFVFDAEKARSVLDTILTSEHLLYRFAYEPSGITATLDPSMLPKSDTVVAIKYDASLNLQEAIRQNSEIIRYAAAQGGTGSGSGSADLGARIWQIVSPSEEAKVFAYEADGSYRVTQGFNTSFYDAAGNLAKVAVAPHDGVDQAIEVGYRYGRIREVYRVAADGTARDLVFQYSYQTAADGTDEVLILDVEENSLKTYVGGVLRTALNRNTSVLSAYEYEEGSDRVKTVTVTRLGRALHTYTYSYSDATTLVTDEAGVVRTYSAAQKLIFMEKNNERFGYTYTLNADGEEIVSEVLLTKALSDGSIVHYDAAAPDGIGRVVRADGTVLTDIILAADNTLARATVTLADGTRKVFADGGVLEVIDVDGTHFYYEDGRVARVVDADGRALEYSYQNETGVDGAGDGAGADAAGALSAVWVRSGDALLKYHPSGALLGLKLEDVLDDADARSGTRDAYEGGGYGPYSVDGDWGTAQGSDVSRSFDRSQGSVSTYSYSIHTFPEPQTITRLQYRFYTNGNGWGRYQSGSSGSYSVEYQTQVGGPWIVFDGAQGGRGDTGQVAQDLSVGGVLAVRAFAHGYGEGSDQGGCNAAAYIYELQYTLADQAFMRFVETRDAQGVLTGYTFEGALGIIRLAADEGLTASNFTSSVRPASIGAAAQALDGHIGFLSRGPYFDYLSAPTADAAWLATAKEALVDSASVIEQEYSSAGVLQVQIKADQTTTLFEDNRPNKVLNEAGEVLIQYFYDADGHPSRVYLKNARDTLPDEVLKAGQSIESQRVLALREVARQQNLAYQSIQDQYAWQRQAVEYQLATLQIQYDDVSNMDAKGSKARNQKSDILSQISSAMGDIASALNTIDKNEADAYAGLDAKVKEVSDQIEQNTQAAFTDLSVQEQVIQSAILKQEISPLIYDAYRRILGRDPSSQEYDEWTARVDYRFNELDPSEASKTLSGEALPEALVAFLNASDELKVRQAYVQSIKDNVASSVNEFLGMSDAAKVAFAVSLGLAPDDLIRLTSQDAGRVLAWIGSRSLHFGQSAFLSLESLLDEAGIMYDREDIATKAILIDILTGVISPLDDGDLVISVYALNTVAQGYGLSLSGAKLSWEDLRAIYAGGAPGGESPRVIAHISGNHFVIVTGMSEDTITYIDPGIGEDKHNESLTIAKKGFLAAWQGIVTAETGLLEPIITASQSAQTTGEASQASYFLTQSQMQMVRGAFWGSLLGLLSWALVFTPLAFLAPALRIASIAVSVIEGDWVTAIASTLAIELPGGGTIGSSIQGAFSSAFASITQSLQPLVKGITQVYQNVTGFINTAVSYLPGIGNALAGAALQAGGVSLGAQVVNYALDSGIRLGISKGLGALGVSDRYSNLVGSLASATFTGALQTNSNQIVNGMTTQITQAQSIQAAVQRTLTLNQIGQLGLDLGLDSRFTSIIGHSVAAIQGQQIALGNDFDLSEAFNAIRPDLTASLAGYGVQELGASLGLDPRISGIVGLPIIGAIERSFNAGRIVGEDIIHSVYDGLTGGVIQIGLDFAIDQLDIDSPLLESLASAVLTRTVSSFLDPNGHIVEAILEATVDFTEEFLGDIKSTEFMQHAAQYGYANALEAYATSVFSRQALEEIHSVGGIAQIISGRSELVDYNGTTLTKVNITGGEGFVLDGNGAFVGTFRTVDGVAQEAIGQFNISSGTSKLVNGTVRQTHPDGSVSYIEVRGGKAYRLVVKQIDANDPAPQSTVVGYSCGETTCYDFDLKEGQTTEPIWEWEVLENYNGELSVDGFNITDGLYLINGEVSFNVNDGYGRSISVNLPDTASKILTDGQSLTFNGSTQYLLLNGVRPENDPEGTPTAYFNPNLANNFVETLGNEPNVDIRKVDYVALFEDREFPLLDDPTLDVIIDGIIDVGLSRFFVTKEVRDVINKLNAIHDGQTESFLPIAYSGGGTALIRALNTKRDGEYYDQVEAALMIGAPLVYLDQITNPNVKRGIMVYGDEDLAKFWNNTDNGRATFNFDIGLGTENTTRITLLGGYTHTDYFYAPELYNDLLELRVQHDALLGRNDARGIAQRIGLADKIVKQEQRIERVLYADAFLARMTAQASNPTLWKQFLADLPQSADGEYRVDPRELFEGRLEALKKSKGITQL